MRKITVSLLVLLAFCGCAFGASETEDVLLQEIKALREEIAELRKELESLMLIAGLAQGAGQNANYSAETSNIITNLRGLKSASTMLYADNMDNLEQFPTNTNIISNLLQYLDNPNAVSDTYILGIINDRWWVGCDLKKAGESDGVKQELRERAGDIGLYSNPDVNSDKYTNQDVVWMVAR